MAHVLITNLEKLLIASADPIIAQGQSAYLKNRFEFYGIKKPVLAQLQKEWYKKLSLTQEAELIVLVKELWQKEIREYHYAALDLAKAHHKLWSENIFALFEELVRTHSWWDSVDMIASNLIGKLLFKHPHLQVHMDKWIKDENFWIRRVALIHQLKYKKNTNHERLFSYCTVVMHEKEFFIRKAIGWALREYSKTNPDHVREFISKHKPSPFTTQS